MKKGNGKKTKALTTTNPNKVNQHTAPDPRSAAFLGLYLDPKSETFSNATQSALKAGYSEEYAKNITALMPAWLSESIGELQMLSKAERNLDAMLDLTTKVQAMGAFGPIFEKKGKKKIPIMVENPKLLNIKKDTSFFVAERIGRMRYKKSDAQPGANTPPGTTLAVQVNVNEDRERYA